MEKDLTRLNISLPNPMLQRVNGIIGEGNYATPSEFIRDVLRREFERREKQSQREEVMSHLRAMIDEGLESGDPMAIPDVDEWEKKRLKRLEKRKK